MLGLKTIQDPREMVELFTNANSSVLIGLIQTNNNLKLIGYLKDELKINSATRIKIAFKALFFYYDEKI